MIPDTVGAVLGLLFVVGPGLAFEVIREHYRPTAERSAFREAAAVALASLVFVSFGVAVLSSVRVWHPDLVPDPRDWIVRGHKYVEEEYRLVAAGAAYLVAISTGTAALIAWLWFRRGGAHIATNITEWFALFRGRVPAGGEPMVRVRLSDGTEYQGIVIFYSVNVAQTERELCLGPPLRVKAPGEKAFSPMPEEDAWPRVLITGDTIESILVRYPPIASTSG